MGGGRDAPRGGGGLPPVPARRRQRRSRSWRSIRAPKLSIPDYVDKPLAAVIARALTPDLKTRYRSAGEFAGPLFGYALDQNLIPAGHEMQPWLESVLGLLV